MSYSLKQSYVLSKDWHIESFDDGFEAIIQCKTVTSTKNPDNNSAIDSIKTLLIGYDDIEAFDNTESKGIVTPTKNFYPLAFIRRKSNCHGFAHVFMYKTDIASYLIIDFTDARFKEFLEEKLPRMPDIVKKRAALEKLEKAFKAPTGKTQESLNAFKTIYAENLAPLLEEIDEKTKLEQLRQQAQSLPLAQSTRERPHKTNSLADIPKSYNSSTTSVRSLANLGEITEDYFRRDSIGSYDDFPFDRNLLSGSSSSDSYTTIDVKHQSIENLASNFNDDFFEDNTPSPFIEPQKIEVLSSTPTHPEIIVQVGDTGETAKTSEQAPTGLIARFIQGLINLFSKKSKTSAKEISINTESTPEEKIYPSYCGFFALFSLGSKKRAQQRTPTENAGEPVYQNVITPKNKIQQESTPTLAIPNSPESTHRQTNRHT